MILNMAKILRILLVLTVATHLLLAGKALAGPDEGTRESKKHFNNGVQLFNKKKYAAALAEFNASYQLYPHWKILYNIGTCYLNLDDPANAANRLSSFLDQGGDDINPKLRKSAAATLEDLAASLGAFVLKGQYDVGVLFIDGMEQSFGPSGTRIYVKPGVHQLEFITADGVSVLQENVTIESGETKEIYIDPWTGAHGKGNSSEDKDKEHEKELKGNGKTLCLAGSVKKRMKVAGWALMGVAAAGLITASITGGLTLRETGKVEDIEETYNTDLTLSPEELDDLERQRDEHYDLGMRYAYASTALFTLFAVSAAAAVVLLPLAFRSTEKKTDLSLMPGPGSLSLSIHWL
jgi:tetratricopeptide (TPR) repeat protein